MWNFTSGGFTSAVQHRDDHSKVMVRARDKISLEMLVDDINAFYLEEPTRYTHDDIVNVEPADYPWRVTVTKEEYKAYLCYEIDNYLTYDNFKTELTRTRGERFHRAAMGVWSAMLAVTDIARPKKHWPASSSWSSSHGGKGKHKYDVHSLWDELVPEPEDDELVYDPAKFDPSLPSFDYLDLEADEPTDAELEQIEDERRDQLNDEWLTAGGS
jgi:hypothetical protein